MGLSTDIAGLSTDKISRWEISEITALNSLERPQEGRRLASERPRILLNMAFLLSEPSPPFQKKRENPSREMRSAVSDFQNQPIECSRVRSRNNNKPAGTRQPNVRLYYMDMFIL